MHVQIFSLSLLQSKRFLFLPALVSCLSFDMFNLPGPPVGLTIMNGRCCVCLHVLLHTYPHYANVCLLGFACSIHAVSTSVRSISALDTRLS
ncbi:uncharacterized protein J3D65DRAFT_630169 [Phyllosticta citribraziliensis]|uniref:Secreted protein n=1 Tax=Phyllosticta citribraziliensis TaxID=989973 RepID=A0ABR1LK81_9PEZI